MSRIDSHLLIDEWLDRRSPNSYNITIEFSPGGTDHIPIQLAAKQRIQPVPADSVVTFSLPPLPVALNQSTPCRPEKVAQAAALLRGSDYPSDQALRQLAGFLASRL